MTNPSPVETFYQTLPADMVAERVKEINQTNKFYWMNNKRGRKVPVGHLYAVEALTKGYTHTDGQIYSEDLTPKPQVKKVSEKKQLADAMERLADKVAPAAPVVEAVAPTVVAPRKTTALMKEAFKSLTRDQLVALALENGLTQDQIDLCDTKQSIIDLL